MLFRYPFRALGSGCEILIKSEPHNQAKQAVQTALNVLTRLENKYSFFLPGSLLSQINQNGHGQPVELDEETQGLLDFASRLNRETGGAFDPTIGGLKELWDFTGMALPDEAALAARLAGVGWDKLEISGGTLRLTHPLTRLDLGGVVKEYAVDCVVGVLEAMGVRQGLVNLGGDLRLVGAVAEGDRPWRVGVASPRQHGAQMGNLLVSRGAVVTSGDYQRYFIRDGVRYHHLLNPRTGHPFDLDFSSVTAHAPTAMEASARAARVILGGWDTLKPGGAAGFHPPGQPHPPDAKWETLVVFDREGAPAAVQDGPGCQLAMEH